jgi:tetratricopeptide (TPR) repeat protein
VPDFRRSILAVLLVASLGAAEDIRALMLQARALQLRGGGDDPTAAAAIYRRVIAKKPASAEAHLRLSEALQEAQDPDGAVAPARRAAELAPRNGEVRAHLALLQFQRAQKDVAIAPEAQRELKVATQLLPQDPELWARLGELSEQLKDNAEALRAWLRLGRLRPSFTAAWERAFIHARALHDYAGKREALLALNEKKPEDRHLHMLEELAREQIQAGYLAHAEESFLLLAKHLPEESGLWENISLIRLQTGRWQAALETLQRSEALKPTVDVSFNTARALMNLGRFQEAEQRLLPLASGGSGEKAASEAETSADRIAVGAPLLYTEALLLQGKAKELLQFLQTRKPDPKTDGLIQVFQTQATISLGDWKAALALLKDGIARFPQVPFFQQAKKLPARFLDDQYFSRKAARAALEQLHLEGMASLWQDFQQWDRSFQALEKARSLAPYRSLDGLLMLSLAYENLGRSDDSLRVLREAQSLEPDNPLVQNNLGYQLLEQNQNLEEAFTLIEASAKASPDNGNVQDSLGWAQFKLGKVNEAEATLRKAVDLSPFSAEVRKHLGEVLVKQGKLAEAAEQWERALAYVFPEHASLEKQLGDLRIRMAKEQAEKLEAAAPSAEPQLKPEEAEEEDE